MSRRAAIDVGTNSVRLLVADVFDTPRARVEPVLHHLEITRLGEGLTPGGQILPAAAARTAGAVARFLALAADAGVPAPVVAGTHALRAASNPDELSSRLDRPVRVLTGEEEARLGYLGVLAGLSTRRPPRRLLVIDIGGGSIELTWGQGDRIMSSTSVPAGAVVLTERFLRHDPPRAEEIAALHAHLSRVLDPEVEKLPDEPHRSVGVGGTITTMAAMALRLPVYDRHKVHGYRLFRGVVTKMASALAASPVTERRRLPGLQSERADIIAAGALVLHHLMTRRRIRSVTASEADLLWSLVLDAGTARRPRDEAGDLSQTHVKGTKGHPSKG